MGSTGQQPQAKRRAVQNHTNLVATSVQQPGSPYPAAQLPSSFMTMSSAQQPGPPYTPAQQPGSMHTAVQDHTNLVAASAQQPGTTHTAVQLRTALVAASSVQQPEATRTTSATDDNFLSELCSSSSPLPLRLNLQAKGPSPDKANTSPNNGNAMRWDTRCPGSGGVIPSHTCLPCARLMAFFVSRLGSFLLLALAHFF